MQMIYSHFCHFDPETSGDKSHPESYELYVFTLCDFSFLEMTKLYENIIMKKNALAPIEVEILLCPPRRTQKIETDSGISS